MARTEPVILTNMCMIYDGDRILVQNRKDPSWSGITFPGGHVEPRESLVKSTIREIKEETGLDISNLQLCGITQWTAEDDSYRYMVVLYKTNTFSGELRSSEEGDVFWIDRKDLFRYPLAYEFDKTLPLFEADHLSENYFWFDETWHSENL